jgi:hypothetical protein
MTGWWSLFEKYSAAFVDVDDKSSRVSTRKWLSSKTHSRVNKGIPDAVLEKL